jgi:uncharacterized protein (UPF0261 family)
MKKQPKIIVAGILDTKEREIHFLAERIRAAGGLPVILELSVGREVGWADIGLGIILEKTGYTGGEIFAMERAKASVIVVEGAIALVKGLIEKGEADGFIACGGSLGTSMATSIMQAMPLLIPKLMLSTMASGDVRAYVGTRDIGMLYPIGEAGLNTITRNILNYAAAGIVGMASAPPLPAETKRPLIGFTMMGSTTPGVMRTARFFEEKGYEIMINHAVGSGGRAMESLIRDGHVVAFLDLSTHEIADFLFEGAFSAGPDRMTAAAARGIPQVIGTGGLELIVFRSWDAVPERLKQEAESGVPGRVIHQHNPAITIVGMTPDEAFTLGRYVAEKANAAKGPTIICVPLRGWGSYEVPGPDLSLGWAGPGPGPFWLPDPERPERSLRARRFVEGLRSLLDQDNPNLHLHLIDRHINEEAFSDKVAELLYAVLGPPGP